MKSRLSSFIFHPSSFLFALAILAYAPFFWERGFYWDELPWTWVYYQLGPAALTKLFSTSRPFWGIIYQVMLPLIGPHPWAWQLLMLTLRWLTAILVWRLFRQLWPDSSLPQWAAALFLVYPGLGQNFIALMYTHFYIILNAFLLSVYLTIIAIQRKSWALHIAALILALANLLTMEYFYFLEFFRIIIIWYLPHPQKNPVSLAAQAKKLLTYLPYFALFLAVTFWRAFFFTNQTASYSYQTLTEIKSNFFLGIWNLLLNILNAFWESVPHAWLYPFEPVNLTTLGLYTAIGAFTLAIIATLISGLYFHSRTTSTTPGPSTPFLILGLSAWILGGGAFWIVGARTLPQLHFSADRFTLSFMLGSSLIITSLLGFLGKYPKTQITLLALLIGFSVGRQFQTNATYRRDWDTQRSIFWQMSWRIPALEPGTTIITNDLPVEVSSDNSLTGPLNWMYDQPGLSSSPAAETQRQQTLQAGNMNYMLYFASVRTQEGRALASKLEPGIAFEQNYLATRFFGNTSNMVVLNFAPPGCLRILDPEIDPLNKLLPPSLRDAAFLSNPTLIHAENPASPPEFYNPELSHGWCYYFSQAELARQLGNWPKVVRLYQQASKLNDHANDPLENFVFIEAFAHTGDWDSAQELTKSTYRFSKEYLRPTLCKLWERIHTRAPGDTAKTAAVQLVQNELKCASLPQP